MSVKNVPDVKEMHTISDSIYNTLISEAKRSHRKETQKSPCRWKEHLRTGGVVTRRTCPDISITITELRKIKFLRIRFLT